MQPKENVSLQQYSTMRLGGTAAFAVDIVDASEIPEALAWAAQRTLPVIMVGEGSNVIWKDEGFNGLVLVNKIPGFSVEADSEGALITVGAGENWDSVVERTVDAGYNGIAELSLIPGTTGATPVQNVGAYGREIADVLVHLGAYDSQAKQPVQLTPKECNFSYRDSRFKSADRGRFFITSITMQLNTGTPKPPFYDSLSRYFEERGVTEFTPQAVRQAVIAIRSSKLPDPAKVANNGSFFANPIISAEAFAPILEHHPEIAHWQLPNGRVKVSAAWLLQTAGFKDHHDPETGMATWHAQPLVLVNESAQSTKDLLRFKQRIVETIQSRFGIQLVQEPELLP